MSELEQKYAVTKLGTDDVLEPGEFFVIRSQDVFGAAALHGYAHLVMTSVELNRHRQVFDTEEVARLTALADDLSELATRWQVQGGTKIPD